MAEAGKRVLFLVNHEVVIYNFCREIVERLLQEGYEVHISSPYGKRIDELVAMGARFHDISLSRHGMNPAAEAKLLRTYRKLLAEVRPDIVLGFTIKPNIYGAMAARRAGIPFVANITGLGTAVEYGGWKQKLIAVLYRHAFRGIRCVFVQNTENRQFFIDNRIAVDSLRLLPGLGVNVERFSFERYPAEDSPVIFSYIGRIMKDKGIEEYLYAAKEIRKTHPEVRFRAVGFFDDAYAGVLRAHVEDGTIEYIGQQQDIRPYMKESWAIIHPSYHEGMSSVLMEGSAVGRPVIASDIPGCREIFDEMESGIGFAVRDREDLVRAITRFLDLPYEKKAAMGMAARKKMEAQFSREIVVQRYLDVITDPVR